MNSEQLQSMFNASIKDIQELLASGQKEYARTNENVFANFDRVGERLGVDRKKVLMVYLEKHMDGIHSYIGGHKSQREHVKGRIYDSIVYLILLLGMIYEEEQQKRPYQ